MGGPRASGFVRVRALPIGGGAAASGGAWFGFAAVSTAGFAFSPRGHPAHRPHPTGAGSRIHQPGPGGVRGNKKGLGPTPRATLDLYGVLGAGSGRVRASIFPPASHTWWPALKIRVAVPDQNLDEPGVGPRA